MIRVFFFVYLVFPLVDRLARGNSSRFGAVQRTDGTVAILVDGGDGAWAERAAMPEAGRLLACQVGARGVVVWIAPNWLETSVIHGREVFLPVLSFNF